MGAATRRNGADSHPATWVTVCPVFIASITFGMSDVLPSAASSPEPTMMAVLSTTSGRSIPPYCDSYATNC